MGAGERFIRWVGLLAVGAISLHELRYLVVPAGHAHEAATSHVHSYLPLAIALAALAFVVSLVDFVTTLVAVRSRRAPVAAPSRVSRAWPAATLALLAIFVAQESLEGALFGGHTAGLHGLFGHGGWTIAIFAPLIGAVIAFLVRGSERAIELVAGRARQPRRKPVRTVPVRPPVFAIPRVRLLARNLAGRAPPALVS